MQNCITEAGHTQILEVTPSSAPNALLNIQNYSQFSTSYQKLNYCSQIPKLESSYTKGGWEEGRG